MPFGPTYDIINTLARWSLNSYFSAIVISNPHEVPPTGPLIVAANHWNMTLDPAMLSTRMPHGRRLHYWAKNTLFKNPIVNFILLDAGNIPVDRTTRNNQLLFKGTFDVLKLGECVALFPEGTSYTEPKIIQMKDGIAWTALEYAKNLRLTGQELSGSAGTANGQRMAPGEVQDVKVIVCGLNYTDKTRYRAAVQVEYSSPITLDQALVDRFMTPGQEKAAVKELIRDIELRLRSVTVNADDWETLWSTRILRDFIWSDGFGPLNNYRENMQQLVNIMSLKEDMPATLKNLRTDLIEYHHQLTAVGTTHREFTQIHPSRSARARLAVEAGRCVLRWPFFLPFALLHIPVYLGAFFGSRLQPGEPESMDQNKVVLGLFSGLAMVPIYVIVIVGMLLRGAGEEWDWKRLVVATIVGFATVIVMHVVHDGMVDGAYGAWRRLRTCWRLKEERLDELWDLRDRCLDAWVAIQADLQANNHPAFQKLFFHPDLSAPSRLQSPVFSSSVAHPLTPPADFDPLLDHHLVDEKSLLKCKKTL